MIQNFDLQKLRLASSDECKSFLKLIYEKKPRSVKRLTLDNFSPFEIYSYLLARFGKPNGFQMLLKAPNADNLVHWHWTLMYDTNYVDFMGYLSRIEITASQISDEMALDQIGLLIKNDINNYREKISSLKKEFEKWDLITNPYARFRIFCDQINKKIETASKEIPILLKRPGELKGKSGQRTAHKFLKKQEEHINILMNLASNCLSLNVFLPVMLESFINLLIFILIKPQIRENERLYDYYLKSQIDVRVLQLNMQCIGFKRDLNKDDIRFKNFHTIMNSRNNTLHGNINVDLYKVCDIYYHDKTIPLFNSTAYNDNYLKFLEECVFKNISVEQVKINYKRAIDFIEYVLENLEDGNFGKAVRFFLEKRSLGWDSGRKKIGDLLPDHYVDCFYGN